MIANPFRLPLHASHRVVALALAAGAATSAALEASVVQDLGRDTVKVEGFIVTANRRAAPQWTVAANTSVISGADLEAAGITYVSDALALLPGAAVARSGSFGATTSLFLRGGESDYVQVLVDGVKVNEPGGSFDLSALTTDNIHRIEIVRGPGSALYGSDAIAGVIQIFTRPGQGSPRVEAGLEGGSFGSSTWRTRVGAGSEMFAYSVSAARTKTDGILAFNNQHHQTTVTGRVEGWLDARTAGSVSVRYEDGVFHYPTDGSGAVVDENAHTLSDALNLGIEASRRWTDKFETRFVFSVREAETGVRDEADGPADTTGSFAYESLADVRRTTGGAHLSWQPVPGAAIGTGFEVEQQESRTFSVSDSEWGGSSSNTDHSRGNQALYADLSWHPDYLALNVGIRMEDNERYGTSVTGRFGAVWRIAGTGRLRLAGGTGIKEPTFHETFAAGFATGNPDLGPERSASVEIGADVDAGPATLSLTWFSQTFRDLIQYTGTPQTEGGPNFHNVAEAKAAGLEAEASVSAGGLSLTATYTGLGTEVLDSGFDEGVGATFVEGERLLRRPASTAGLTGAWRVTGGLRVDLSGVRVGSRSDRDFSAWPAEPVVLPSYTRLDLGATLDLPFGGPGGFALRLRAENLFDAQYEQVYGFPSPGRGIHVGGKFRLGGAAAGGR